MDCTSHINIVAERRGIPRHGNRVGEEKFAGDVELRGGRKIHRTVHHDLRLGSHSPAFHVAAVERIDAAIEHVGGVGGEYQAFRLVAVDGERLVDRHAVEIERRRDKVRL